MKHGVRKGTTRAADIPREILHALSHGELQCATLAECLAVDQAVLTRATFPALTAPALNAIDAACQMGVLKRMARIGSILLEDLGAEGLAQCQTHRSDMVRGWACFMIGAQPDLDVSVRLTAIRPLADDAHFGVREWAWMAMRPHLVQELPKAIAQLMQWTQDPSERIRRFACEVLRPRGVWCTHISTFKHSPEQALPLLSALNSDPSVYVQDSVANWLNDAAKDQPTWVRGICAQWLESSPTAATRHTCQRALRNLK
ncbi:HEAT repeat domain-containing protein [Comamonas sp.]|jgi:3-methyladenine DNA glycosylase AlkC|uniref:HEAT repeat domain-containing protein n=1 Tax=Comamonas sp. TaxID=34028 RepID=UPI0035E0A5ED